MKQLCFFFFFISLSIGAQNFFKVDSIVSSYPKYRTPESLAKQIEKDFHSDLEKTRAAFKWLTHNIRYSLRLANSPRRSIEFQYSSEEEKNQKLQSIRDQIVKDAFTWRQGVCEEYAQSLKKLCDLMTIESEVIKGNVRNSPLEIGRPNTTSNHAWNVVFIDGKWIVIDATWASGYSMNGRWIKDFSDYYFDMPTKLIDKTHFPESRKWQLTWNTKSYNQFYNQPIYYDHFFLEGLSLKTSNGVLSIKRGEKVNFEIVGLKTNQRVFVGYQNERYSKKPQLTRTKNKTTLVSIDAPTRNTYMNVFIDGKLVLIFKIVLV